MTISDTTSDTSTRVFPADDAHAPDRELLQEPVRRALYGMALMLAISVWFIAFRSPLGLDETGSYWQVSNGLSRMWSDQRTSSPAYASILWLTSIVLGKAEMALRVPSVLAMLAAARFLYLIAKELFEGEVAMIATVIFCLHPFVWFAAIDVRPYAFAVLAVNAAVFVLVRFRRSSSSAAAALFGFAACTILYFHFLFASILPALAICFVVSERHNRKNLVRHSAIALAVFVVTALPLVPGLLYLFITAGTHSYEVVRPISDVAWVLWPGSLPFIFGAAVLGAGTKGISLKERLDYFAVLLSALLAFVPLAILYGITVSTPIHILAERYRLVAIPGIALCWALLVSRIRSHTLRAFFCIALVSITAYQYLSTPRFRQHYATWKYVLEVADRSAAADRAPVLICSEFVEADYTNMPLDSAKTSVLFAPLSYYKVSMEVVPLPKTLNQEAVRVVSNFLQDPARRRGPFLAVCTRNASGPILDFITIRATDTHYVRNLGQYDGIAVLEFIPRPRPTSN